METNKFIVYIITIILAVFLSVSLFFSVRDWVKDKEQKSYNLAVDRMIESIYTKTIQEGFIYIEYKGDKIRLELVVD